MTLKTYADWEEAVRVARVTYDHSQAKLVTGTKGVRKSKEKAFLSVLSTKRPLNNASSEIETPTSPGAQNTQATVLNSKRSSSQSTKTQKIQIFISTSWASSICLQLRPSTSIADLKRLLQERLGIDSEKQHLFTRKGLELCDVLSIADHSIEHDATIELRLVSGLMGGRKKKRKSEKQQEPKQNLTPQDASASKERSSASQISSSQGVHAAYPKKRLEPERKPTQEDVSAGEESPSVSQKSSSTSGFAADSNMPTQSSVQIQHLTIKGVTNSPIIFGSADASSFNYAKVPVDVDVIKNGETHGESNATIVQMIKDGLRQHGKTHMMTLFTKAFAELDAEVGHVQMGSVKLVLHVKSQKGLDKLWNLYTSGELAKTFTEILITDELTTEDKSNMAIKVTILESDYQEGCKFFEKLPKDNLKQETLPLRMSDWTKEHVKMWLLDIGVLDSSAQELYEGGVHGKVLKIYDKEHLREDFSIKTGDIRLILHSRDKWLDSEQYLLTSPSSNGNQMLLYPAGESHRGSDQVSGDAIKEPEKVHTKAASQPVVRPKMPSSRLKDESGRKKKIKQFVPSDQHQASLVKASGREERTLYGESTGQESTGADIIIPPEDRITPFQNPLSTNEGECKSNHDNKLLTYSPVTRESIPACRVKSLQFSPDSPSEAMSHKTSEEFPGNQMTSEPQPSIKYNEKHQETSPSLETQRNILSDIKASIGQVKQNREARLRTLLTGDECGELDQSYPLLVANKAPCLSYESSKTEYIRNFEFIKTIKWTSVLDFDSQSLSDGLCKLYHANRMVTLQQPHLFKKIKSEEDLRDGIGFPEKTLWLFANGREDNPTIGNPPMDLQEWNKERSRDVEASISFFSQPSVIPKGRAAIVFLLLSDQDLGIVCDIFRKMSSSFQGIQNITCIAEDENVYAQFVTGVEKWFSKAEIDERSMVGQKWQDINRIMMRMHAVNQIGQHELPFCLPGNSCFLPAKQKEEWNDITVICKNECENTDVDESIQGYQKFAEKKELNFYRGAKIDWWNFVIDERERKRPHACGHVLKRNGFGKTLQKVVKPLDRSKSEDSLIVTVTLLHQPGAGGSTFGRQILWELHKDHRCIVVDKITTNTVNQILGCRRYGYTEYNADIPPVCVLIDDFDDVEVLDLIVELEEASKDTPMKGGVVCVLLHCKRNMDPIETIKQIKTNSDLYVPLVQKLTEAERAWFESKYIELDDKESKLKTGHYKPQNLLAFMVMKEEFNKDYIKDVVSQILRHSDANKTEKGLIKMCAFLNSYMHEAEIPISCCDSFMEAGVKPQKTAYLNRRILTNWEKSVSAPFKIIVLMTENRTIKILHESVAQEALKQILTEERQTIADVALAFLNSDLMRSWSYSRKDMAKIARDLLVRRTRLNPGDNTKTDFSRLIEDVSKQHGPEKATEILQSGVDTLQDASVAQQLARLHLKEKNFEKAVQFAERALKLNPQKSYFWDTKGRVYKTHFNTLAEKYVVEQQVLSADVCKRVISLSFQAMNAFHKAYDVSKETMQIEYNGLYAEVDVAFRLLNVIQCAMEPFRTKGDINILRKYLLDLRLPPDCYPKFDEDCSSRIRELKQRVESVLHIMDDNLTFYKDGSSANVAGQKLDEMREKMRTYSKTYQEYYGEPSPLEKSSDIDQDPESLAECRRRKVIKLQCRSFGDIFNLAKECQRANLKEARDLLLTNSDHYNVFDLRHLVCIHLALSSAGEQVMSADEVYQQFVRPLNTLDHSKTDCWPPFFMMMFLWPIPDAISERRDREDLSTHIDRLQNRWIGRQKHLGQQSSREDKFSRHARFDVKPRTHFFLGHGKDLQSFVHIHEILATQRKLEHDNFWQSKAVKKLLLRLEGTLLSNTSLVHLSKGMKIRVKLAYPYLKHTPSQETVTFYLGFSWNGPVAYNVTPKGKESCHDTVQWNFNQAYPEHILPINKTRVSPSDGMEARELERQVRELRALIKECSRSERRKKERLKVYLKEKTAQLISAWQEDED